MTYQFESECNNLDLYNYNETLMLFVDVLHEEPYVYEPLKMSSKSEKTYMKCMTEEKFGSTLEYLPPNRDNSNVPRDN